MEHDAVIMKELMQRVFNPMEDLLGRKEQGSVKRDGAIVKVDTRSVEANDRSV